MRTLKALINAVSQILARHLGLALEFWAKFILSSSQLRVAKMRAVAVITAVLLNGCAGSLTSVPEQMLKTKIDSQNTSVSLSVTSAEQLLKLSQRFDTLVKANDDFLRDKSGDIERTLPDRSYGGVKQASYQAGRLLQEFNAIVLHKLSHEDTLTAALLKRDLELLIEACEHHWVFFDVTGYNGGYVMSSELLGALNRIDLAAPDGVEHYLSLFTDAGRFINELTNKLQGQRQRGILLSKAAIPQIRTLYFGVRESLKELIRFDQSRLKSVSPDLTQHLKDETANVLHKVLYPALDRLLDELGDDYMAQAPKAVGLYQYPGGKAYYQYLIQRETSLDLTAEQIHQVGLLAMEDIHKQMQAIRQKLGFTGTAVEFHKQLTTVKRLYDSSPEEVEQRYLAYVDRIKPHLAKYFSKQPQKPYGVKRASPMAELSMAAGYYSGSVTGEPGYYYYNGSNLDSSSMISAGFLIYHELVPGHHFHLSLAKENGTLSVYRQGVRMNAFSEGWANYAAHLALEIGMLDDPYDHYGFLLSHAFISARLVLDTGLNHKRWSLHKASRYMLENTISSESQVATEVLRYSTNSPAQALTYKLGYDKILGLRQTAKKALGEHFDLKKFHSVILSSGTLSMPVLEKHIQWYIAQELK